ncbi:alkyl sulfatase dimerization domain-containing protein [Amycolatopsis jejuensis]|uniref:alkyl sulfatase dimerization domain-containing protein n=1 Tax=Amycolatopsis jejuensis TaxID=330084 RepID=UPI000A06B827|nr:alkyl sulfatase dimerization domain-containing protein [Amycolatopsis jejuensis]
MTVNSANPFSARRGARDEFSDDAGIFWRGGRIEIAPGTWFLSHFSGVTAFETADGLVLVDASSEPSSGHIADRLREVTSAPVHTVVYTHGHRDHAYGLPALLAEGQAPPEVIAHPAILDRFDRYGALSGYNEAVRNRQFAGDPQNGFPGPVTYGAPEHLPTRLVESATITVGGCTFEIHHARGETDDALWVWNPDHEVVCTGDLFIWAVPNAGNPQKVQRYPWEWAAALREMAAKRPRTLCPGHGGPVVDDPDKVQRMLLETAAYLEQIVEQTIALLNDGAPPHVDIVHAVRPPESDAPWLRPVYDEAEFIVRNVIRYFGGWWSGRPSELKPASRTSLAAAVVGLSGGVEPLLAEAERATADGELRLACHLADWALEHARDDHSVRARTAAIYLARAESETSLMAINLFRSAASYATLGRDFR